ncbi:MAG: GGDEF domain-containing protein [Gaiellaceae bacterium]
MNSLTENPVWHGVAAMNRRASDLWPVIGGGVVAFAATPLGPAETTVGLIEVLVAAALFVGVVGAVALVPWERLPRALGAVPVAAVFAVIGLLRDAGGGPASGYGTLVLLPVFWLALHGSRAETTASLLAVAAVFIVPIVVEPSYYPSAEWRRALIWLLVTPIVGLTTHGLVERVRESARIDALTGLANSRAWEERLPRALALSERTRLPLSVALLDLDGFKAYNDAHGHQAGDRLLASAAAAWRAEVRSIDLLARLGGDEFGLLLPSASLKEAVEVVMRATTATPDISCSVGVAQWDGRESAEQLVRHADAGLYAHKADRGALR